MHVTEIHISIGVDGNVDRTEMKGFEGDECLETSKPFEDALGGKIVDRQRLTPPPWEQGESEADEGERERERV